MISAYDAQEDDQNAGMIQSLQKAVNAARKAENRVKKVTAERVERQQQWRTWEADLKKTYAKERQRFSNALAKLEQDLREAVHQQGGAGARSCSKRCEQNCWGTNGGCGHGDGRGVRSADGELTRSMGGHTGCGPTACSRDLYAALAELYSGDVQYGDFAHNASYHKAIPENSPPAEAECDTHECCAFLRHGSIARSRKAAHGARSDNAPPGQTAISQHPSPQVMQFVLHDDDNDTGQPSSTVAAAATAATEGILD